MKEEKYLYWNEVATIIGLYRMGNNDAVICAIVGCELYQVFETIKKYIQC